MHNGEVRLKRIGLELPKNAVLTEWIENAHMIIACGKVIRRRVVANIYRTVNEKLYLNVQEVEDPGQSLANLEPGVYFDIPRGARVSDFEGAALRQGIHDISNIIRMCRTKRLRENNEYIWTMRKKVLRAISDLYQWLDIGVYEIIVARPNRHCQTETSSFIIRRPDYASGGITNEEQQKLAEIIDNWMDRANRTKRIDSEKLVPAINKLYRCCGLKEPRVVIVSSPLQMAIAGSFATAICYARKNHSANADSNKKAIEAIISEEIYEATVQTAFHGIEDSIDYETEKTFEKMINDQAGQSVHRSINRAAGDAIECAIADAKKADRSEPSIAQRVQRQSFEESIATSISHAACIASGTEKYFKPFKRKYFGSTLQGLAEDLSRGSKNLRDLMLSCLSDCRNIMKNCNMQYYDECLTMALKEVLGLKLPAHESCSAWQDVVTKCGAIVMHEEFCIASDFPEVLRINEQGRPHSNEGPSSVWRDKWRLYHWHGTRVTEQLIERPNSITVENIKQERNLEVRRLMLDRYGVKRFLIDSDAKKIHQDECGVLYSQVIDPALEPIVMVKVINSTEESDGTHREYFLRVPPHFSTAKAAVAWTFGLTASEYCPLVQT